jgi:hypothetical protein
VWRTTTGLEHAAVGLQGRHTKVGDFDVGLFVQQQVFRFQIPVTVKTKTKHNRLIKYNVLLK